MTLDLGWQGMQSKFWVGMLSFAGLALVALAQYEGTEATTNKAGTTQGKPVSGGTAPVNESDTVTAETALEGSADVARDRIDGAPPEAAAAAAEEPPPSATADDKYTPTERISEDRSVSFPVDI